ncbi:C40 family peptidase [Paenibacillus protaetiae]|uniref:NlpC/P60 family protein n=1 Tax=Paenibacillus protaetiae TaxID=2509456 RepID=A0A4P6EV15_9BACL|nr:C40 family peptidase [Paenibacillus protaetiae]QAY65993.1 NlpC/P60 family protein [Paenibacillus protaetiae]
MKQKKLFKMLAALALTCFVAFASITAVSDKAFAATTSQKNKIVSTSKKFVGTPYKYGASTSTTRYFDCSSFTQYVFKQLGVKLPRTSLAQSKVGKYVSKSNLQVGDLVFFYSPVHHVGIYIGNGKMINTYGSPGVTISSLNSSTWKKNYKTARRVL